VGDETVSEEAGRPRGDGVVDPASHRSGVRAAAYVVVTVLAFLLVWFALVAPNQLPRLRPGAFARIPIEGLFLVVLVLVLAAGRNPPGRPDGPPRRPAGLTTGSPRLTCRLDMILTGLKAQVKRGAPRGT
jgi:hypothetical protein